jgi:hypothetical protein
LLLVSESRFRDGLVVIEGAKSRFSLSMAITLAIVALVFWGVTRPLVVRSHRNSGQTNAVSNARQIGLALFEFENEFGRFPDETTGAKIRQKAGNLWNPGASSSNDFFRQLIVTGYAAGEPMFYAQSSFSRKPDNRIEPSEQSLAPGEVGFGYLMNGGSAFNTEGNPARPIACAPLAFDGKKVSDRRIDPSIYDGKAVILRIDNSVQSIPIDQKSGAGYVGRGKTLLDTGLETVWGDSAKPVIIPPLPKR